MSGAAEAPRRPGAPVGRRGTPRSDTVAADQEGGVGAAAEAVAAAGRRLQELGLVARTWGNISVRIDETRMAITPSGIPYDAVGPEEIVVVDLRTGAWTGTLKPSGERKLHAAVYAARRDVGAVVHTHQNAASVFAAARRDLPGGAEPDDPARGLPERGGRGGSAPMLAAGAVAVGVRCAPYALPGTGALSSGTLAALGASEAAFMANHGALCVGTDLDAALWRARSLELACADAVASLPGAARLPGRLDAPWSAGWIEPESCAGALGVSAGRGSRVCLRSKAPFTMAYSGLRAALPVSLDDLAQLVGPSGPSLRLSTLARGDAGRCAFVPGGGAICAYDEEGDAEAAAMVLEKACMAALAGELLGGAARIPLWETALMRFVYLRKYSRLGRTSPPRSQ